MFSTAPERSFTAGSRKAGVILLSLKSLAKWSPPGGVIRVQLDGDRLRVADQGPGIADVKCPAPGQTLDGRAYADL